MKARSQKDDVVYTPKEVAQRIIEHLQPSGIVMDPCRGGGAFDHPLVTHSCEIQDGTDFLQWDGRADWIIGNPPWSQFNEFNCHALDRCNAVAWLYHIPGLLTRRRMRDASRRGFFLDEIILLDTPPPPWPQSGFQVAVAVWRRGGPVGGIRWTDWTTG